MDGTGSVRARTSAGASRPNAGMLAVVTMPGSAEHLTAASSAAVLPVYRGAESVDDMNYDPSRTVNNTRRLSARQCHRRC
jgi:hypothetical protein